MTRLCECIGEDFKKVDEALSLTCFRLTDEVRVDTTIFYVSGYTSVSHQSQFKSVV